MFLFIFFVICENVKFWKSVIILTESQWEVSIAYFCIIRSRSWAILFRITLVNKCTYVHMCIHKLKWSPKYLNDFKGVGSWMNESDMCVAKNEQG